MEEKKWCDEAIRDFRKARENYVLHGIKTTTMEDNFLEQGWDLVRKGLETYDKFKEMKNASTKATDDVRERVPLLIIEGKDFYKGDIVPFVVDLATTGGTIHNEWNLHDRDCGRGLAFFLTRESAEKWIACNQKSISFNELGDYLHLVQFDFKYSEQLLIDNVLKHFKPKT